MRRMTASSPLRQTSATETLLSRQSSYKDETKIIATVQLLPENSSHLKDLSHIVNLTLRSFRVI